MSNNKIRFVWNGCDITLLAEAPPDITLEQLLKQCDRVKLDYCACGICSPDEYDMKDEIDISFDYDDVKRVYDCASCTILPKED